MPWTYDAYRHAFETAGDLPGARLPPNLKTMIDVVHDLDLRGAGRAMPLPLPFIRFLAAQMADRELAARLDAWVAKVSKRLGTAPVPPASSQAPSMRTVHVELTAARQEHRYTLRMWLHRDVFECIREADSPVDLATAQEQVGEQLVAIYKSGIDTSELRRLEFHVPFELLDEPFETWVAPLGVPGRNTVIGEHFEVVVRCPGERSYAIGDHWRRKWDWFAANNGADPEAVKVLGDDDFLRGATKELLDDAPPVCLFASVSGEHLEEVLYGMLEGGIPIAVWPRGGYPASAPIEHAFETELRANAKNGAPFHLRDLPARIRSWRSKSYPTQQSPTLVLLWDDPSCRPSSRIS
ncbi:hypothetical protein OIE68_45260 [Nocardia vinacea]|uniref:VMAP-C domain-containing protein n=1 Tax=Nocardia vinacea TaxID=96468 RepID=UPI002E11FB76|nr:hypothetical protein OIE68_45260 [Nocardia vinacea]